VFILKEVKVVCFDTLLQVLILKNLYCTKIVQEGWKAKRWACWAGSRKQKRQQGCWRGGTQMQFCTAISVREESPIVNGKTEDFFGVWGG